MYKSKPSVAGVDISFHPPASHALRPEKKDRAGTSLENAFRALTGGVTRRLRARAGGRAKEFVSKVERHAAALEKMTDEGLRAEGRRLGLELHGKGFEEGLVANTFALVREVSGRVLGMRHFETQLAGGWVLLKGMVAEMEAGEGKTLTATLAASAAALAGIPVHVICFNDYLTARDAELTGPVYRALGLSVGCVIHEVPPEARRAAYRCDITYCCNKEIAFDYLKDGIALGDYADPLRLQAEYLHGGRARVGRLMLRGLHFAIVDEADSLLVDEARTPLIISAYVGGREEEDFMRQAMSIARDLKSGADYNIDKASKTVALTGAGEKSTLELSKALGPLWAGSIRRNETVRKALSAIHLYDSDVHYLVRDGKVMIVDEYTGRVMPDRSWEKMLHQLIEIKEDCEVTRRRETIARISYQSFFRRYLHLSGMTGTAKEVAGEMWAVYGLPVVRIPTHRPSRRMRYPDRIYSSIEEKEKAVAERVRELNGAGRPVLVGTRSVAASERMSGLFTEAGLPHVVLNAKNDREEAEIVARAGELKRVTIATNIAGRGTDIKLGPGVAELQGLHVVITERHEAARIDRQLAGRAARQGDPGSYGAMLSLEDPLVAEGRPAPGLWLAKRFLPRGSALWRWAGRLAIRRAQKRMERLHARVRQELLRHDRHRGNLLSFSGSQE